MTQTTTLSITYPSDSVLEWTLGSVTRSAVLSGGRVAFSPVTTAVSLSLDDFDYLIGEFSYWLKEVTIHVPLSVLTRTTSRITLTIGAKSASVYDVGLRAVFLDQSPVDGPASLEFVHHAGSVTFLPRPQTMINWADLVTLNRYLREFITVARAGKREYPNPA